MKQIFLLLFLAMGAVVSLHAKSRIVGDSVKSDILGRTKYCNVYLPDGFGDSNKKYPVLYLLHGLKGTHNTWPKSYDMQRIVDATIEAGLCHPMIIIMPDASGENAIHAGRHTGYQNQKDWKYEDYFFQELMPQMEKKYRAFGDTSHRAIAGLSMGGHGTCMYATDHPEMFNSACPLSGRLTGFVEVDENHDQEYIDDMKKNDFVKNFPHHSAEKIKAMKKVRWMFDCGDDDFLLDGTLQLYMLMRESGFNVELRVRNGGHVQEYWRTALPNVLTYVSIGFTEQYLK